MLDLEFSARFDFGTGSNRSRDSIRHHLLPLVSFFFPYRKQGMWVGKMCRCSFAIPANMLSKPVGIRILTGQKLATGFPVQPCPYCHRLDDLSESLSCSQAVLYIVKAHSHCFSYFPVSIRSNLRGKIEQQKFSHHLGRAHCNRDVFIHFFVQ